MRTSPTAYSRRYRKEQLSHNIQNSNPQSILTLTDGSRFEVLSRQLLSPGGQLAKLKRTLRCVHGQTHPKRISLSQTTAAGPCTIPRTLTVIFGTSEPAGIVVLIHPASRQLQPVA
jgi:hypothetical protein